MARLIGITGKAGSGKDTFASFLEQYASIERYSFAGPLKDACCLLFGWTRHQVDHDREFKDRIDPRWGFSPRRAMQLMGTEYGRELLRDDLWVHMAEVRLKETTAPTMVVTDVRFENEAEWVRKSGGTLVHIVRYDCKQVEDHASEAGVSMKDGDIVISNLGTIRHLEMMAENLATTLKLPR